VELMIVQVCEWQQVFRVLSQATCTVCSVQDMGTAGRGHTVVTRLQGTSPTGQERSGDGRTDRLYGSPFRLT